MFSFKYHFSCKFKHLSSAEQYPSPTSTLICRRVLPPWYLEIIMGLHNFLWVLPLIHNAFGKLYPLLGQPCSAFELVVFTIEACGICFHDTLTGWIYAFINLCEPESFHGSYSSGNSPGRFWHWNHLYLEQWMKGYWNQGYDTTRNQACCSRRNDMMRKIDVSLAHHRKLCSGIKDQVAQLKSAR